MRLNRSDMRRLAQLQGRVLGVDMSGEEMAEALNNPDFKGDSEEPMLALRNTMVGWLMHHYDRIAAQASCGMDCIVCPSAQISACFLYNRKTLIKEERIDGEDPWLRK